MFDRALSVGWISKKIKKKVATIFLSLSAGLAANDKKKVVTFFFYFLEIHSTVRARSKAECPDFGQKAVLGNKPHKLSGCIALVFTLSLLYLNDHLAPPKMRPRTPGWEPLPSSE